MTTLYVNDSGDFREACDQEIIRCAQGVLGKRFRAGSPVLTSPERTREFLRIRLATLDYEVFGCLYVDKRHRLIKAEDLFRGTIDGAIVHPRELIRAVILNGAAAVVLYHNHSLCCFGNCHPLKSGVELQGLPAQRTMTRRARRQGNPRWRGRAAARSLTACAAAWVVSRADNVA